MGGAAEALIKDDIKFKVTPPNRNHRRISDPSQNFK
jgi:hypothetical protein